MNRPMIPTFRFWCQKVLPLVYENSLSYYEVLCKVVDYINELIDADKILDTELEQLKNDLKVVQNWIDNYDDSFAKDMIEKYIGTMIFVEINNEGYVVYNIPENWKDITFNTTGLDIVINSEPQYGHLVLSY